MATPDPQDELSKAEREGLLGALSPADWARANSLARVTAAGLVDMTADDLLHEVVVGLLSCERTWRRGVHPLVTIKVAMHSVASNARKKAAKAPIDRFATVSAGMDDEGETAPPVPEVDDRRPEDAVDARFQLARVIELVKGDAEAELVLMAWAMELRGDDARKETGFEAKQYDAARKRFLRRLKDVDAERKTK